MTIHHNTIKIRSVLSKATRPQVSDLVMKFSFRPLLYQIAVSIALRYIELNLHAWTCLNKQDANLYKRHRYVMLTSGTLYILQVCGAKLAMTALYCELQELKKNHADDTNKFSALTFSRLEAAIAWLTALSGTMKHRLLKIAVSLCCEIDIDAMKCSNKPPIQGIVRRWAVQTLKGCVETAMHLAAWLKSSQDMKIMKRLYSIWCEVSPSPSHSCLTLLTARISP